MRIHLTPFLLFLPLLTIAQYESLLQKKDILWAAEAEVLISFDPLAEQEIPGFQEAIPTKVMQEDNFSPHPSPVTRGLIEIIGNGRWQAFADAALTQPLTKEAALAQMTQADTVVVFDPETYEEKIVVVRNESLENTSVFALRQLYYYDGRDGELKTWALAIAPTRYGGEPEPAYRPMAWFKLPPAERKLFRMQSRAVPYVTLAKYNLAEKDIKVLKGADFPLKAILFEKMKSGAITGYDPEGKAIPSAQVPALFSSVDTIITFDPETYEEKVEVVQWDFNPEDVGTYRLKQSFFFAPRQAHLQCRPEALAPSIGVTDEYGQLLYLKPLFYWRRE